MQSEETDSYTSHSTAYKFRTASAALVHFVKEASKVVCVCDGLL